VLAVKDLFGIIKFGSFLKLVRDDQFSKKFSTFWIQFDYIEITN